MENLAYRKIDSQESKANKRTGVVIALVLVCICLFHVVNNYFWIKNDVLSWYPEKYYQLIHKNTVFFSLESISHSNQPLAGKIISVFKMIKPDLGCGWGVIFYIYTACFNLLFSNSIGVSLISNLPFFMLLIFFTFLIGKELVGAKEGLFAAFLVSFYPGIYGMSRSYGVDFPLVTMVTICIYILLVKDITKIKYALLFGLLLGITLLIKVPGAYFLIGPMFYIFCQHIYEGIKSRPKNNFINKYIFQLIFALVLFMAIPFLFLNLGWGSNQVEYIFKCIYSVNFPMFTQRRHFYWVCPYNAAELKSIFFYLFETIYSLSRPLFLLFCAGFLLFLRQRIKSKIPILLWITVPYVILTLCINKWGRYYFPVFPALALITAIGVFQIRPKKIKIILISLVVLLSLVQFYDLSFGSGILPKSLYRHPDYSFTAYSPGQYQEGKIVARFLKLINKESKDLNYKWKILFIAPHSHIDHGRLEYIFQTETKVEFSKFFSVGAGYENCDYIIVLNDKARRIDKPDLSFLKAPNYYGDFLRISYPQYSLSNEELAKMYEFFTKFEVVDYYYAGKISFYLCKNSQKK
ncbi:MAG: glycosyltransferase family 39 protein [Candidatus Omnitrophica bacterium]|nr:glycosyltransferase family 39 protein [Candidatus Omnitrophota bacterium]